MLATIQKTTNPYEELLGAAWESLPLGVRLSHTPPFVATGNLAISGPTSTLGRFIAKFMRLPPVGASVPTRLSVTSEGESIRWERRFGDMVAVSHQVVRNGCLLEKAGPFTLMIRPSVSNGVIVHRQVGLRLWGLPIPMFLGPTVTGSVSAGNSDSSWTVDVVIGHALVDSICRYSGVMEAE